MRGNSRPCTNTGGKIGVLLELACGNPELASSDAVRNAAHDITLHIAACNPTYLVSDDVPADIIASEREIFTKQAEGKPPEIIDKIVDGKLRKFNAEVCLLDQPFVKEPKQSVTQYLSDSAKAIDTTLQIKRFLRYELGGQ